MRTLSPTAARTNGRHKFLPQLFEDGNSDIRIQKKDTAWRKVLEPGIKLAIFIKHKTAFWERTRYVPDFYFILTTIMKVSQRCFCADSKIKAFL